jgi:BASS family bile acid:Na+ symporter
MADRIEPLLLTAAIVIVMFSVGLQVTGAQILAAIRQHRLMAKALLANMVLLPLLALALSKLVAMPKEIAIGFLIASAAPGTSLSPKLSEIAHANISFALGLLFVMAALSTVTTPLTASLFLASSAAIHFSPWRVVGLLILLQLFPLIVGLAVHRWQPAAAQRIRRPSVLLANVMFFAVVAFYVIRDFNALRTMPLSSVAAMIFMTIASLAAGWLLGGPDKATRQSLAMATSVEFTGLALLIVAGNFPEMGANIAVVAYGLIMIVANTALALYWNRQRTFSRRP